MNQPAPRAAIYARYSTDMQSAASIDDQIRVCRKLCADRGWSVAKICSDQAMSGSDASRPGFQELRQAIRDQEVTVIVAEALDRLSRDQEHLSGFFKLADFHQVLIFTKSEGEVSQMHVGLGGTMSATQLRELANKTHRGLEGRIHAGKSAGGISYGYRPLRQLLENGDLSAGELVINDEEARFIRRIFRDYANGLSPVKIAAALNAEGVPSPRARTGSGHWKQNTINGNRERGTGILNNELDAGQRIWNRLQYRKDPETSKRVSRLRPRSE